MVTLMLMMNFKNKSHKFQLHFLHIVIELLKVLYI